MFMLYSLAALAASVIAYLAVDFYNEQLKTLLVPVRAQRSRRSRRARR
jgi:hypothetical protein